MKKDIETYGVLKLSELGKSYIKEPHSFMMTEDHIYDEDHGENIVVNANSGGGVADKQLMNMLKDLRKSNAKKLEYHHLLFSKTHHWKICL